MLWGDLIKQGVVINFAHRTFRWSNDARVVAAVHCVIVGVGVTPKAEKWLFEYPDSSVDPIEQLVENINPYLLPASTVIIQARGRPVSDSAPNMLVGGKPVDGGHLLLNEDEKALLIETEPGVEAWIRPFTMGVEFINGISRWCLWLIGISPAELRSMPAVLKRVEAVRQMRLESPKLATGILLPPPRCSARYGHRTATISRSHVFRPNVDCTSRLAIWMHRSFQPTWFVLCPTPRSLSLVSSQALCTWGG